MLIENRHGALLKIVDVVEVIPEIQDERLLTKFVAGEEQKT